MVNANESLKKELTSLLKQRLSPQEETSLRDEGFVLKKPTRQAAIAIALYKKAVSGDLTAIKELRSALGADISQAGKAVTIIDDT